MKVGNYGDTLQYCPGFVRCLEVTLDPVRYGSWKSYNLDSSKDERMGMGRKYEIIKASTEAMRRK